MFDDDFEDPWPELNEDDPVIVPGFDSDLGLVYQAEQVQGQYPSQQQQITPAAYDQTRNPAAYQPQLPVLQNDYWNTFQQDRQASRRNAVSYQSGAGQSSSTQSQQVMFSSQSLPELAFPLLPPMHPVAQRVLTSIIYRLNSGNANIYAGSVTPSTANDLFNNFRTNDEYAMITAMQTQAPRTTPESPVDPLPLPVSQPTPSELPDVRSVDQVFLDDNRAKLSPLRQADGTIASAFEPITKRDRPHLRKKCFPCLWEKRGCNSDTAADGICDRCKHREKVYLKKDAKFDAKACCHVKASSDFEKFLSQRIDCHGKAKPAGEGWKAERDKKQKQKQKRKQKQKEQEKAKGKGSQQDDDQHDDQDDEDKCIS